MSTVEAYGAIPVKIDPPEAFELSDGQRPESMYGMKVGEVTYILMGVEEGQEREALGRTNAFYLGFFSGFVPVFQCRVADIIHVDSEDLTKDLPVMIADYNLAQEARREWPWLNSHAAYKKVEKKTLLRFEVEMLEEPQIIEAGDYLIHDFSTGKMIVLTASAAEIVIEVANDRDEEKAFSDAQLQEPERNGEPEEK